MNDLLTTGAIYIGGYLTTKYVVNYAINKATEKAIEGTWNLSKKAANVALEHIVKRDNEEKCDYLEYELIEIDPVDRDIIRVISIIEIPSNETPTYAQAPISLRSEATEATEATSESVSENEISESESVSDTNKMSEATEVYYEWAVDDGKSVIVENLDD